MDFENLLDIEFCSRISKKKFADFQNFKSFLILIFHKPSLRSHTQFGPDRFSRFDVYWIQPNKQTDKPNLYVDDYDIICIYKAVIFVCLLVCPIQTEEPRTDLSQILIMELGRHTGMFL